MDKINEVKNKLDDRAGNPHLGMERQVALDALNVITEQESEIARLRVDLAAARNAVESAEMSAKCSRALKEKAERENLELLEKCRRLELANEQLRLKLDGQRDRIVKLSAECDKLKQKADILGKYATRERDCANYWYGRYNDVCNEKTNVVRGYEKWREELTVENGKIKQENDKLMKELRELREKLHEATVKASSFVIDPDEVDVIRFERCPVCKNDFRFFLKMPKAAEVVPPIVKFGEKKFGACPKCGRAVDSEDNKTACGRCGKLLDWGSEDGK